MAFILFKGGTDLFLYVVFVGKANLQESVGATPLPSKAFWVNACIVIKNNFRIIIIKKLYRNCLILTYLSQSEFLILFFNLYDFHYGFYSILR
jgi:hypothetical protein